jgi:hypothetical protein
MPLVDVLFGCFEPGGPKRLLRAQSPFFRSPAGQSDKPAQVPQDGIAKLG